jgi:hypothetical protein
MSPTPVYSDSLLADALNIAGGVLYFGDTTIGMRTNTSNLKSCVPANCASSLHPWQSGVIGILTTNGSNLYWVNGTVIDSCSIASCTPVQYSGDNPSAITNNGSSIFWSDGSGYVYGCSATSGACTNPVTISSGRVSPGAVAADSNYVYWADNAGIMECPVGGCGGSAPIALGTGNLNSLVTDGTYVYWTDGNGVWRARPGVANSAIEIVPNETGAGTVGVGSVGVYWSTTSAIRALAK